MSIAPRSTTQTQPGSRPGSAWPAVSALCVALLGACCSDAGRPSAWNAGGGAALGSKEAAVAGTVLDAESGEPVPNVRVEGPRGTSSRSDARGRFRLTGLEAGDQGELHATTGDGRSGTILLQKLAGGELEVVLYLARKIEQH